MYTEFFHNETAPFILDSEAIFSEFYFDVADNHKLTLGLRYTQDRKEVRTRATFYDGPLTSNWNDDALLAGCAYDPTNPNADPAAWSLSAQGAVTFNAACQNDSNQALTVGQRIGSSKRYWSRKCEWCSLLNCEANLWNCSRWL